MLPCQNPVVAKYMISHGEEFDEHMINHDVHPVSELPASDVLLFCTTCISNRLRKNF
jgi:hypothetical protein